jgi:metal-responsive CopG/Arc/MetJ family transcriptional regulator
MADSTSPAAVASKSVLVRMPVELLEAIDRRAAKRGVSREEWVRQTLAAWTRVDVPASGYSSRKRAAFVLHPRLKF